ncbi:hypothetical protein OPV22_029129 [Ensete ventricosum]|uniref:Uncharacterized protein n=1 Tax=Ensete ventricosum TaxID=4639 RepID=A0AAV8P4Q7_ENSVE|nr:hypothetical protein OPV22_029129 [Ensete ventricosum]
MRRARPSASPECADALLDGGGTTTGRVSSWEQWARTAASARVEGGHVVMSLARWRRQWRSHHCLHGERMRWDGWKTWLLAGRRELKSIPYPDLTRPEATVRRTISIPFHVPIFHLHLQAKKRKNKFQSENSRHLLSQASL